MKITPRQQAQDLILLAHKIEDSFVPGQVSVREILNALSESNTMLVIVNEDNNIAEFALQLLEDPTLENYDPSVEVMI